MRIALVIPEFHKQGGTERCMADLAEALSARGHHITIFSNTRDTSILPDAVWHRVPMIPRPHLARFLSFLTMNLAVRIFVRFFKGERFDIIHSTGPDVLHPTVTTLHCCASAIATSLQNGSENAGRKRWLPDPRRWSNIIAYRCISLCERYVVRSGAKKVLAVSKTLATEILEYYRARTGQLSVVPNGVHLGTFHSGGRIRIAGLRGELRLPQTQPVVLFVGHNWERKGLGTLISALVLLRERHADLRPFLLVVGGRGGKAYKDGIRIRLRGDVQFLGTRTDMPRIYHASDICVLPSEHESFGLPVLEAMACGLPAVVSRCAGVAEIITDGVDGMLLNGLKSPEELAEKIERLIRDPALRKRLGEHALETAERYSWESIVQRIEALYYHVLTESA